MELLIEKERLKEIIDYLSNNPKIVFSPYPEYDSRIFEVLGSLGFDKNYQVKYSKIKEKEIEKMTLSNIKTVFSFIERGERFCDGHIASYVEDGILLRLAKREKELIDKL